MERMEVRYQLTVGDLAYAKKRLPFSLRWLSAGGPHMIALLAITPVSLLLGAAEYYLFVAAVWSAAVIAVIVRVVKTRKIERKQQERIRDLGEITLSIQPDGIEASSKQGWTRRSWHCVDGTTTTGRHIVIRVKPLLFHIVPFNAFPSPETAQQFVALAEKYRQETASATPISLPPVPDDVRARAVPGIDQITFERSRDELLRYYLKGDRPPTMIATGRKYLGSLLVMIGTVVLFFSWTYAARRSQSGDDFITWSFVLAIVLLGVSAIIGGWVSRMIVIQMLKKLYAAIPLGQETLTLAKDGFLNDGFYLQSWQSWSLVDRINESPNFLIVSQGASTIHVIPKRAFATPQAAHRFLQMSQELFDGCRLAREELSSQNQPSAPDTGNPYQAPKAAR